MAKFELVFCLNKRNPFLSRNFLNSPLFERVTFFHVAITGNFERFKYFNFAANFLKNPNPFHKLDYCFLVESTKTENATFSCKTALSEVHVKTNSMGSTNGPITKNGVSPVTTLSFRKLFFSLRTSYKELIWCNNHLDVHIHTFRNH